MEYIIQNVEIESLHSEKQVKSAFVTPCRNIWKSRWTADISLLLVALIWGTTYVAAKDVVTTVPVLQFLFIRFALTTILMLPLTIRAIRKSDRSTWTTGIFFGVFLFAIFTLETFGVAHTSAANAGFMALRGLRWVEQVNHGSIKTNWQTRVRVNASLSSALT